MQCTHECQTFRVMNPRSWLLPYCRPKRFSACPGMSDSSPRRLPLPLVSAVTRLPLIHVDSFDDLPRRQEVIELDRTCLAAGRKEWREVSGTDTNCCCQRIGCRLPPVIFPVSNERNQWKMKENTQKDELLMLNAAINKPNYYKKSLTHNDRERNKRWFRLADIVDVWNETRAWLTYFWIIMCIFFLGFGCKQLLKIKWSGQNNELSKLKIIG